MNWAAVIGIVLWALVPGFIAKKKGRSFWGYYFLSFLISPLISTIVTLCVHKVDQMPVLKEYSSKTSPEQVPVHDTASNTDIDTVNVSVESYTESAQSNNSLYNPNINVAHKISYCRHCGYKLIEDSEFCSNCGTRVEKESVR